MSREGLQTNEKVENVDQDDHTRTSGPQPNNDLKIASH